MYIDARCFIISVKLSSRGFYNNIIYVITILTEVPLLGIIGPMNNFLILMVIVSF